MKSDHCFSNIDIFFFFNLDPMPQLVTDIGSVEGITFDWISKNLFFTDFRRSTLSVIRANFPSERRDLIKNLGNARSIVVHPLKG